MALEHSLLSAIKSLQFNFIPMTFATLLQDLLQASLLHMFWFHCYHFRDTCAVQNLHSLPYSCLATKVASNESKAARDYIFRSTSNFAVLETLPSRKKPQNRCFVQTERCASYSTVRNLYPKSNNAI